MYGKECILEISVEENGKPAVFVTASGWLKLSVNNSEKTLDRLYRSTAVEAEIVRKNAAVVVSNDGGAFIHRKTVQEVMDTGYVERVYLEAATECDTGKKNGSSAVKKTTVLGITEIDRFLANDWNKGVQIHYDEESGADLFQRDCTIEEGICRETPTVIVPEAVWVMWNLESDDLIYIGSRKTNVAVILKVEGYYTGELGGSMKDAMLAPLSFAEALDEDNTNYTRAEFTLDTAKNRELADFCDAARAIVEAPAAGELELLLVVWDNELRQVAEPMEKNINLMKVLYPVANIVSFFIAAGLGVLLLFQRRREAAILRVLGVGAMPVRLTLSFELLILNVVGVLVGLAVIYVVTEAVSLPAMGIAAAAYFAGGVIGAIVGSGVVTKERPLELLQVKE